MKTFANWQEELRASIKKISDFPQDFFESFREELALSNNDKPSDTQVSSSTEEKIQQKAELPFSITPCFFNAICESVKKRGLASQKHSILSNPLFKQVFPTVAEKIVKPCELSDPLGEHHYTPCERLVHQYKNRVLLLSTGTCISYCRHCFRRTFTSREEGCITEEQIKKVCAYLKEHQEVKEILVSGGDPMTISDEKLFNLLAQIREASPNILIRIGTRAIVFLPTRFTKKIISHFASLQPLWIIPHINHPDELTKDVRTVIKSCVSRGIPFQSQTVLLRGVNDCADTLEELFEMLVYLGVKPGYLFQGDLAPGTSHFRVPLSQGLKLYQELETRLSGLSLPTYAVDLPDGGGKIPLGQHSPISISETHYTFQSKTGKLYTYPNE